MTRLPALALLSAIALALAACGDDGGATGSESAGDPLAALQHVHGLGVDPGSRTLYVATHHGLFQAADGQTQLERTGDSRQDLMGFSVAAPGRFIASGHPDPSQNLPPTLGLIESRDDGGSWRNISLLGEADFHVLRSAGSQVYGFPSSDGGLMVSGDDGRAWERRTPPGAMFDLAVDPTDSQGVVVSTDRGILSSPDGGRGWRPLRNDVAGLLAWPAADSLFLVDGEGEVSSSKDTGKSFRRVGSIGGPPAAFTSHGDELYAALRDGNVVRSSDGGASWAVRARP